MFVILFSISDENVQTDVDVALNAQPETGYPYSVPILITKSDKTLVICGATIIGDGVAITAGHCAENASSIRISNSPLDLVNGKLLTINTIYDAPGFTGFGNTWRAELTRYDMAIIEFSDTDGLFSRKAVVASPKISCNYRIVSYGTTLEEKIGGIDINNSRYAQGLDICILDMDSTNFLINTGYSGVCFGDSGSPIFEKDSNKIVGIISSTVGTSTEDLCNISNFAIAVRLDANYKFISQFIDLDLKNLESNIDEVIARADNSITSLDSISSTTETPKVDREIVLDEAQIDKQAPGEIEEVIIKEEEPVEVTQGQTVSQTLELSKTQILLIVGLISFGLIMLIAILLFMPNRKVSSNNKLQV